MAARSASSDSSSSGASTGVARCGLLLRLEPPQLESEFWVSGARFLLPGLDIFAIGAAVVFNCVLLQVFAVTSQPVMLPHERATVLLYPALAALQVWAILCRSRTYMANRLRWTLLNRLGRLLVLAATSVLATPELAASMGRALRGFRAAAPVSAAAGAGGAGHHTVEAAASAHDFLRLTLGPPFVGLCYSLFMLPVRFELPVQACMLAVSLRIASTRVCWFLAQPGMAAASLRVCTGAARAAFVAGALFGSFEASPAQRERLCADSVVAAALLLTGFIHVTVLLLVPCTCSWLLERSSKRRWLKQHKGLRLACWRPPSSALACSLGVSASLLGAWLLVEAGVAAVLPLECDASGWLVAPPAQASTR